MCFKEFFENVFCCRCIHKTESQEALLNIQRIGSKIFQDASVVYSCTTKIDVIPGTSFNVTGTILKNCERFAINLTLGQYGKDVALHINPRLPQNYIVRNSKINGSWGKEETTSAVPFTLQRGDKFGIQILVTEPAFNISVNGRHYATYTHRIPYPRICCLQVVGDVSDVEVDQLPVQEYPDRQFRAEDNVVETFNRVNEADFVSTGQYLELPYYGKLSEKFTSGTRLNIIGRVKVLPHSFYLNLQQGNQIWPHPTIAFHLNPRFANQGGKHVICKNAWLDNDWGKEERNETHTDFMPSRPFNMSIECHRSLYAVYMNKKLISEFKFRVLPELVDTVYIQGDINLQSVTLETSPSSFELEY